MIDVCPQCFQSSMLYASLEEQVIHCSACGYESTNYSKDEYTLAFRRVLQETLELARGSKTADYGEAWRATGLQGIYIKLMIKHARLRQMVWDDHKPQVNESVRDTLIDMIAYATYGVLCLDEGNQRGPSGTALEQLEELFSQVLDSIQEEENKHE